ncbi:MAG: hypothetical protein Tsb0016_23760 [Sphingomonadales bacterium]
MTTAQSVPQANNGLSAHARRVMARLAKGARAHPLADGGYRLGALKAPASLIENLRRQDLLRADRAMGLALTLPGEAALRRAAAPRAAANDADAFTRQQQALAQRRIKTNGGRSQSVTVNMAESPLYWLMARKDRNGQPLLTPAQFEAGERLRDQYETAHRGPAVTMRWAAPPTDRNRRGAANAADPTTAQLAARRRVEAALEAVGPGLADLLIRVCCAHQGLEAAERAFGWPQRSAKVVLQIALDRLARHYGLN